MAKQRNIGRFGERVAYVYLKNNGYTLVDFNIYGSHGEVDLVVIKNEVLVCIEVKTTTTTYNKHPETAVNSKKIKLITAAFNKNTAYFWSKVCFSSVRFDVVAVIIDTKAKKAHIHHYKDLLLQ
ncbi:MAG: YraN family protein [Patescibacteria group bacterium]